ncbi:CHAT domain-containing protein [Xanthobacter sp. KR7-65]|uniref:CHAT domain-containing protein n=1 Tax=Xanthobacter sp. KR7-65 TaxID=3156612 RepID=UPI0032B54951
MHDQIIRLESEAIAQFRAGDDAMAVALLGAAIGLCDASAAGRERAAALREKLGRVHLARGDRDAAQEAARRGLADLPPPDADSAQASLVRARLLITLGNTLFHRGAYDEAAAGYDKAATLLAPHTSARGEGARALSNAGLAAREAGRTKDAIFRLKAALALLEDGIDGVLRLNTRRFLANALQDVGELAAAAELLGDIEEEARGDPALHAQTLEAFAGLCERQGDPAGASAAYKQALASCAQAPRTERAALALVLVNAGQHAADLGDIAGARRLLTRARRWGGKPLSLALAVALDAARADLAVAEGRPARAVRILQRCARKVAAEAGADAPDALALMVEAEELERETGRRPGGSARLARAMARAACAADHPYQIAAQLLRAELLVADGALDAAEDAVRAVFAADAGRDRTAALSGLFHAAALLASARGRHHAGALFGKMAVAAVLSAPVAALAVRERDAYLARRGRPFRQLIATLASRARLPEAEHIHGLVQRDRLAAFAARDAELVAQALPVPFRADEDVMAASYRAQVDALREIGKARALAAAGEGPASAAAPDPEHLRRRLVHWFDRVLAEDWVAPAAASRRSDAIASPPPGVAHLRFLDLGDGSMRVVLRTCEGELNAAIGLASEHLAHLVHGFRTAILHLPGEVMPLGRELYAALIAPVAAGLGDVHTLHLALDPPLLHLPFAALHDGTRHLVERWALAIDTGVPARAAPAPERGAWRVAAFAATHAEGFAALPYAAHEARRVAALRAGVLALDGDFTSAALRDALHAGTEIIHIASHFQLVPARPERSCLALGDGGSLSLAALRRTDLDLSRVELLVLSACATATADLGPHGPESLAGLAQLKGARSVVATLWPVVDAAAAELMTAFYAHAFADTDRPSLAEALRRAQAAMATGRAPDTAVAGPLRRFGAGRSASAQPAARWAAFVLHGPP